MIIASTYLVGNTTCHNISKPEFIALCDDGSFNDVLEMYRMLDCKKPNSFIWQYIWLKENNISAPFSQSDLMAFKLRWL